MRIRGLVIFDAFNTLVTAHADSRDTFLAGLRRLGLNPSRALLAELQVACEALDHSASSGSRQAYVGWARDTLSRVRQARVSIAAELAPRVVPALEQLHQAPMVPLPDAAACLRMLKEAGFVIAVCSNWGWDLRDDLGRTGLTAEVDIIVTSAQVGFRKPHPRIYQYTLRLAGFSAGETVFVGDSLRADVLGPQRVGVRSILLSARAGHRGSTIRRTTTGPRSARGDNRGSGPGRCRAHSGEEVTPLAYATVGSGERAGQDGDWPATVRLLLEPTPPTRVLPEGWQSDAFAKLARLEFYADRPVATAASAAYGAAWSWGQFGKYDDPEDPDFHERQQKYYDAELEMLMVMRRCLSIPDVDPTLPPPGYSYGG